MCGKIHLRIAIKELPYFLRYTLENHMCRPLKVNIFEIIPLTMPLIFFLKANILRIKDFVRIKTNLDLLGGGIQAHRYSRILIICTSMIIYLLVGRS